MDISKKFHYVGISGDGMSAIAQFHVRAGGHISGSDRAFDNNEKKDILKKLTDLGIDIYKQDGSGVDECDYLVTSTAIESTVPDFARAQRRGIEILHRSDMLAHFVAQRRTIAIGGTSGKSTVVAMVFEILSAAGKSPSLITGGKLVRLMEQGMIGNAWNGESDILVIEADESDGTIVKYEPEIGVVLNLSKDHKEQDVTAQMFGKFKARTRGVFLAGDDQNLDYLKEGALRFGLGAQADVSASDIDLASEYSAFAVENTTFKIPLPGLHNVQNALAAIAVCRSAGVGLTKMVKPLADYGGVHRRFQSLGKKAGIEVIDDFAHNPVKIMATIRAAQLRGSRVIAIFQPHGFYPTRFMWKEFIESFTNGLRSGDMIWLLEIYYAGGTTQKDISSADLVREINQNGGRANYAGSRETLLNFLAREAREGDVIVVMGARDATLSAFAEEILSNVGEKKAYPLSKQDSD